MLWKCSIFLLLIFNILTEFSYRFLLLSVEDNLLFSVIILYTFMLIRPLKHMWKDSAFKTSNKALFHKYSYFLLKINSDLDLDFYRCLLTQPDATLFLSKSIWTRPQGSQGCQKITFYFLQMKLFSFCAKIAPKRHKLQKPSKLKKKCQRNPVFLDFFEYSSNWGQS